jgi:predicted Ser/Thr protein kinase
MNYIGKYKILGTLGKGGMGIVYKALDPDIERDVAIKTIRFENFPEGTQKDDLIARFVREARAAGKLAHANIVTIYEVGRENDTTYIVMQYIEGRSLQALIDSGQRLTLPEISAILEPIADALGYAHQNGIVHRDIKPANILIDKTGKPYLADFGVARVDSSTITRTGTSVGTLGYMSPEQVKGQNIDNRSDIFALGIVLYELLTGKTPFPGDNISTIVYKIVHEQPPRITEINSAVPPGYDFVIEKALAKNPEDRYQNCRQFVAGLKTAGQVLERTLSFETDKSLPAAGKKRRPLRTALVAGAGILAIVGGWFLISPKTGKTAAPSSPAGAARTAPAAAKMEPAVPSKEDLGLLKAAFDNRQYDESLKLADGILAKFPADPVALETKAKARSALLGARVAPDLQSGIANYTRGDYGACLTDLGKVLTVDRENGEAQKYYSLAETALSKSSITALIERHRVAEEHKDLLALLADVGNPALAGRWQDEHRLLFNGYNDIQSAISGIAITFAGRTEATANFFHLQTAVYKKNGIKRILAEGNEAWHFKKPGKAWVLTGAD